MTLQKNCTKEILTSRDIKNHTRSQIFVSMGKSQSMAESKPANLPYNILKNLGLHISVMLAVNRQNKTKQKQDYFK